ncbi:MAG: formylmethanofuran dehydrogenase subunit A [Gammaproteobacteria bacterium]|nr:formylmethanofuran dehydrogenase subunit A [Gammaproteobacteria bacterium]
MLVRLKGAVVYDPMHGIDGRRMDLFIRDGIMVPAPRRDTRIDHTYDVRDRIVMAGAIDIHTHIGGGKVNIARALLPEDHMPYAVQGSPILRAGSGHAVPTSFITGYRYAEMGYTACFEPAMLPANARHAHAEMADVPIVDTGAYALLGNDDFLLRLLAGKTGQKVINDYVAWIVNATHAHGVKVVNPGGISAFKFNQRDLDLDVRHEHYGVSPRRILKALARAVHELGICHPLHVHGCNLGVPGNAETTLKTIAAVEGLPLHLTHVQFHSYGREGDRGFSSAAARIAEAVNSNPNISIDVGQVMFGQTVTASGDTMLQYRGRRHAHPKKWVCMDIECDAGCGVVPFLYRDHNFVNALQWCVGLELFLQVRDPWRIFLTTDHPNGAPFTTYPRLIRLLMDRAFRAEMLDRIHPEARKSSILDSLDREYSLAEIAIMTRAAPARSLGLQTRGHLGRGAAADITVYEPNRNAERMFSKPALVFKDGVLVVRDGKVIQSTSGQVHATRPAYDRGIERVLKQYFDRYHTVSLGNFRIGSDELLGFGRSAISVHPCVPR